jgi:O-antigen/teichoic acid export membrane protein
VTSEPEPVVVPTSGTSRRVATHSVIYVLGAALQGLGILLIIPFATRLLGAAEFGRVATGLVVVQMVGTLAAAGLPQVIIREHHRGTEGPRVARALAGVMILFALAVGVVGTGVLLALSATSGVDLGTAIPVLGASVALTVVVSGQSLMRARMRPGGFLALAVGATVLAQLAGLLAAWQDPTAGRYLGAYAAVLGLVALGSIALGRPLPPTVERTRTRAGIRLAAPLLPQAVALLGLLMGDVLLTRWLLGEAATGGYQVALQLGNMPFVLSTALFNAWGPLVLSHPLERRAAFTARTGSALTVIVGLGALGVALLGPWLVALMAPASFGHAELVRTLGPLVGVAVLYMVYQGGALAVLDAERTGRLAWSALAALVVLVVVAIPLSGAGTAGIAVAKLAAYAVLAATTTWFALRHSALRWPAWVGTFTVAVIAAAAFAGGLLPLTGTGAWTRGALAVLVAALAGTVAPRVLRALRG